MYLILNTNLLNELLFYNTNFILFIFFFILFSINYLYNKYLYLKIGLLTNNVKVIRKINLFNNLIFYIY